MNNYSNPMVTYDEIIEAIRAILESSKANGYLDDYSFLNVRYDILNKNPLYEEQEQALIQAIQSLEKTIDAADKVIRENLRTILNEIAASNLFIIPTKYKKDEEYRKLAAQSEFVMKLREMSLPLEILSGVPKAEESQKRDGIEDLINPPEEIQVEEIPSLEEEEKIDYYSRVKLGNVKNAFAVTEEQYEKLRLYVSKKTTDEEPMDLDGLSLLIPEEENTSIEGIEAVAEVEKVSSDVLEEESLENPTPLTDDLTVNDIPVETVKEEVVDSKEENSVIESEPIEEDNPTKEELVEEPKKKEEKTELSEEKKALMNRIQLIKKALDKAKEKENTQLIQILEQQLRKEIEIFKS